jgi:hypothetical protein
MTKGWGGLRGCGDKMQGGAQENLWPKSVLERPVARHFVWAFVSIWRAVCKLLKTQVHGLAGFVGIALERERFTSVARQSNEGAERLVEGGFAPNYFSRARG